MKWHFSLVEALPSSKFWKSNNGAISWTEWNFAYTLILTKCTSWDCQMTFEIGWVFAEVQILEKLRLLQNDNHHRSRLCRASSSEKVIMALSLELSGILHTHWYWQNVPHEIVKWHLRLVEFLPRFKFWKKLRLLQNDNHHRSRLCRASSSEKVKMALSLDWVEYFDRLLRKHWYYPDLAHEIVKCHFSSV